MKSLALKLALPLTILSMGVCTKWWYVLPTDARETYYWGFPFVFVGEGWHTSLSLQFFMVEWVADIVILFLFWVGWVYIMRRFSYFNPVNRYAVRILWSLTLLVMVGAGIIITFSSPIFHLKRDYDFRVIQSGYMFFWQNTPMPNAQNTFPKESEHPNNP